MTNKSTEDFERARKLLLDNGFSNSMVVDLLTKRKELRDGFAMAALQGLIAGEAAFNIGMQTWARQREKPEVVAGWALEYADAMLEARRVR